MRADCLQPGGIVKEGAKHNVWAKGIAPSDKLRKKASSRTGNARAVSVRDRRELNSNPFSPIGGKRAGPACNHASAQKKGSKPTDSLF